MHIHDAKRVSAVHQQHPRHSDLHDGVRGQQRRKQREQSWRGESRGDMVEHELAEVVVVVVVVRGVSACCSTMTALDGTACSASARSCMTGMQDSVRTCGARTCSVCNVRRWRRTQTMSGGGVTYGRGEGWRSGRL